MSAKGKGHAAGRGIVLDVTEEIISVAIPRDSGHCVVADALKAAVPSAHRVSVDLQTIRFTDPATKRRYVYLTPSPLQALLVNFDQGIRPQPFMIRLGKPAQIVKSGRKYTDDDHPGLPSGHHRQVVGQPSQGHPTVLGGNYPPTAALSSTKGRRRTYGLRSLRP